MPSTWTGGSTVASPGRAASSVTTTVQLDGSRCNCGKRGCWETVATLSWLRAEAKAAGLGEPDGVGAGRLVAEAAAGSVVAARLLDAYARNLAVGIANLQQTMSLNAYVLHGDAATGGDRFAGLVRRHVEDFVLMRPNQDITVIPNGTGDGLTALKGAAGLIVSDRLKLVI